MAIKSISPIERTTLLGFAVALSILLGIGAMTILFLRDIKTDDRAVQHSHAVIENLQACLLVDRDMETSARSFILTGSESNLESYKAGVMQLSKSLLAVQHLTLDNPAQQRLLAILLPTVDLRLMMVSRVIDARRKLGQQAAIAVLFQRKVLALIIEIRHIIGVMQTEERALLRSRINEHSKSSHRLLVIILFGFAVAIAFLAAASILVHADVLARERVEEELQSSYRELESFSYSVSHDLRAPLRGIEGFSRLILEENKDLLNAQSQDNFNRISAATKRMGLLIDEILDLSRIVRAPMQLQEVDLAAMARATIDDLRKSDPSRRVHCRIPETLPARADAALLGIALTNLLSNAWKFTSQKPDGEIALDTTVQEGKTVYYIRDNGAGFDMAYQNKLFQPFQRLHTQKEYPGSGIGLATVARIIRRHGGRVWAEGGVDQGATFYFTLG